MHLADAFIQSDLQCIQGYTVFLSVCVFRGNWTHDLLRCQRNALTTEPQEHRYIGNNLILHDHILDALILCHT